MRPIQIAKFLQIKPSFLTDILVGRRPGYKYAIKLASLTQIPIEAWLSPEIYFNPYIPFRYQGYYPPDLSHLSGEPLKWAHKIIEAFPDRPPNLEEWRSFRKHFYKKNKTDNKEEQRNEESQIDKTSTKLASF